jgi:hypothetical protein
MASLTPAWTSFIYATLGGFAINLLRWLDHAQTPKLQRPTTFGDPMYVAQFIILPLLGGFVAYLYSASGTQLTPLLAVNVGISAPLILRSMAAAVPVKPPDSVG